MNSTLNGEWRSTDFDADTSSCEQLLPPWSYSITIYSFFGAQNRKCKNAKFFTRIIRNYAVLSKNMTNSRLSVPPYWVTVLLKAPHLSGVWTAAAGRWRRVGWLRMTHQVVLAAPMLTVKVLKLNGEAWRPGGPKTRKRGVWELVFNDQGKKHVSMNPFTVEVVRSLGFFVQWSKVKVLADGP